MVFYLKSDKNNFVKDELKKKHTHTQGERETIDPLKLSHPHPSGKPRCDKVGVNVGSHRKWWEMSERFNRDVFWAVSNLKFRGSARPAQQVTSHLLPRKCCCHAFACALSFSASC